MKKKSIQQTNKNAEPFFSIIMQGLKGQVKRGTFLGRRC